MREGPEARGKSRRPRFRRGGGAPPPAYDAAAVGRVARHVEILGVELLGAHFERIDDEPLPAQPPSTERPQIAIGVEWKIDDVERLLGCAITFGVLFEEKEPYRLVARFRLLYLVGGEERLKKADIDQFAHWNAVFNAWPYWREYLASTLERAHLPPFIVPVMRVPMPGMPSPV